MPFPLSTGEPTLIVKPVTLDVRAVPDRLIAGGPRLTVALGLVLLTGGSDILIHPDQTQPKRHSRGRCRNLEEEVVRWIAGTVCLDVRLIPDATRQQGPRSRLGSLSRRG